MQNALGDDVQHAVTWDTLAAEVEDNMTQIRRLRIRGVRLLRRLNRIDEGPYDWFPGRDEDHGTTGKDALQA